MKYIEVSSTEGTNIGKVMETILSQVEKNQMWQPERRQTISLMSTRYDATSQLESQKRFKLKGKSPKESLDNTSKGDALNKFGWSAGATYVNRSSKFDAPRTDSTASVRRRNDRCCVII